MTTHRTDLMRELVAATGHVVTARITAPQARRVVEIVVLKFDERALAGLGDRRTRGTVTAVSALGTRRNRAQTAVMKMIHVGTAAVVAAASTVTTPAC